MPKYTRSEDDPSGWDTTATWGSGRVPSFVAPPPALDLPKSTKYMGTVRRSETVAAPCASSTPCDIPRESISQRRQTCRSTRPVCKTISSESKQLRYTPYASALQSPTQGLSPHQSHNTRAIPSDTPHPFPFSHSLLSSPHLIPSCSFAVLEVGVSATYCRASQDASIPK